MHNKTNQPDALLLLFPMPLYATGLMLEIEKKAAALSSCSLKRPCTITVERSENIYIAKVKRSVKITEYGVLKYKTGSITYHMFDEKGVHTKTKYTTWKKSHNKSSMVAQMRSTF